MPAKSTFSPKNLKSVKRNNIAMVGNKNPLINPRLNINWELYDNINNVPIVKIFTYLNSAYLLLSTYTSGIYAYVVVNIIENNSTNISLSFQP